MNAMQMSRQTYDAVCGMAHHYYGARVFGYSHATHEIELEFRSLFDAIPFASTLRALAMDREAFDAGVTEWRGLRVEMPFGAKAGSLSQSVVLTVWQEAPVSLVKVS